MTDDIDLNPERDLLLKRHFGAAPETLWRCWTEPELLCQWFCPRPWQVSDAVIELHPGGRFFTRMRGPEGEDMPNEGCFLLVEPVRRLVFTDFMRAGFRPNEQPFMVADVRFTPGAEGGCDYVAIARHTGPEPRRRHEEMGFHDGWGAAADQLAELAERMGT